MPTDNTYKAAIPNWEEILAACAEHADALPDLTTEIASLKTSLDRAKTLKVQQESSKAARQGTTQDLKQAIKEGQEFARRIRDAAKFKIGQRNERLVQFKVKPLRPRSRKNTAATAKPETQAPETRAAASPEPAKT